jgi:hypothetical protein
MLKIPGGRKPQPATLLQDCKQYRATPSLIVQRNRLDLARARGDTRQWVQDRRARTRRLIELGGLVQKAGLVDLVDDDRATLLGAFLELAARLHEDAHQQDTPAGRWRKLKRPSATLLKRRWSSSMATLCRPIRASHTWWGASGDSPVPQDADARSEIP